jgi:aminoglycoside phosphotransferase family enzyme
MTRVARPRGGTARAMREIQDDVIAFLADPASHGAGVDTVERIDTHISVVFLAGARVFKLKRAVTLPFLDYGTLEKRRFYCEREVALNRRTAPALDSVEGILTAIEPSSGQFMIKVGGDADNLMNFRVNEETDLPKFLDGLKDGDKVTVGYDSAECARNEVCVSTAVEIDAAS